MYEFWYGYVNPEFRQKLKLCYMDTDNFLTYIKGRRQLLEHFERSWNNI